MSTLREDFESWGAREGSNLSRHPGRPEQYANTAIQGRWLAYQAATERAAKLAATLAYDAAIKYANGREVDFEKEVGDAIRTGGGA